MRALIFSIITMTTQLAFAHGNEASPNGCETLQLMHERTQESRIQNSSLTSDLEQAFETLCRQSHKEGDAVYYPNGQVATVSFNTENISLYYPNRAVLMEYDADGEAVWYYPNGEAASGNPDALWNILFGLQRKAAKIEALFKARHAACAKGCSYVSWGIWGDEAHKKRKSCHNSGEAIDIHAIKCGKVTSGPKTSKFKTYVNCMKSKFTVLFQVKDHFEHAHIQIPNCRKIKLK